MKNKLHMVFGIVLILGLAAICFAAPIGVESGGVPKLPGIEVTGSAVPLNGLYLPAANNPSISSNGVEAFRFPTGPGSSGNCLKSGGNAAVQTWGSCGSTVQANWSANCIGATLTTACAEDANFTGAVFATNAGMTSTKVTCSWNTAGTGGTTGVVIQVWDADSAAEVCHCTLGACTTAANVPLACDCAGAYTNGHKITLRQLDTTDCAGDPADFSCNASYTQ